MYFRNYGLRKTWLDKYLKLIVSHYPSRSKIVKALKHCSNLNDSTFAIFMSH